MFNLNQKIITQKIGPSVYAIVLFSQKDKARFLWLGIAYTFEGALLGAKEKAKEKFPKEWDQIDNWKALLFNYFSIEEFSIMLKGINAENENEIKKQKIKQEMKVKEKLPKSITVSLKNAKTAKKRIKKNTTKNNQVLNTIMKKIIKEKDRELFRKNKNKFNATQIKYIKDALNKKK